MPHVCNCSKIFGKCFFSVREMFYNNISCISYPWKSVCHFQVRHVEVKIFFQSTCKTRMFFQNFQNEVIKCFQTVSIQEKIIKIDRTHYKRKLLSPNCFSKNQNWILKSPPKFSNFQKMAILRKWKYPIFLPKVYKIKKLRQLFLSKCLENNFKTFDW